MKKYVELPIFKKVELILRSENTGVRQLAREYGVSPSAVCGIIKRKAQIMERYKENLTGDNRLRKVRRTEFDQLNRLMWEFVQNAKKQKVLISNFMLQRQALDFSITLGIENFKASYSWAQSFRQRFKIDVVDMVEENGKYHRIVRMRYQILLFLFYTNPSNLIVKMWIGV